MESERETHLPNYGFTTDNPLFFDMSISEDDENGSDSMVYNFLWSTWFNYTLTSPLPYFLETDDDTAVSIFNSTIMMNATKTSVEDRTSTKEFRRRDLAWVDITLIMIYCCIIAATLIGNTLVIAAVATTRRLRTVTNCFVTSLAVADWLVGMFVMPIKVVYHLFSLTLGSLLCKIWIILDVLLCTSSILSLCTISIDRYLAITRPLAYSRRRRSKRLALAMISCVWAGSLAITSPVMFGWFISDKESSECEYADDPFYVVYSALGSFFVPLFVMLYVYARIACVIARRQKSIQKVHKTTDKKYCDTETPDEVGLTMHRVTTDISLASRSKARPSSAPTFKFFRKDGQLPKNSSLASDSDSISYWSSLRCVKTSNKKGKSDPNNRKETQGDMRLTSPSEIPSPSTLLSMGARLPTGSPTHENKYISGGTKYLNNGSTGKITNRTGSRLCHHNITNSSPPLSIIQRVLPSSSSTNRVGGLEETELNLGREFGKSDHRNSRVWTIEQREKDGILDKSENERLTRSNVKLNCHYCLEEQRGENNFAGTSSAADLPQNFCKIPEGNSEVGGSRMNYTSSRQSQQHGLLRQHGKYQSQSCSHLISSTGKNWNPSHVKAVRSRSMKTDVSHQLSDQTQAAGPARDFSTGRVASFKRETKTAQTLAAVVGGFIICWLPFFVAYVIGPFIKPHTVPRGLMEFFVWLGWGNSAINPAIYAFYNPDFRSAFYRLTIHKCNGIFKSNKRQDKGSPRRYDREPNVQRTSA